MTEKRYFTTDQINALIPKLEGIFEHIQTCKTRAEELAPQAFTHSESVVPSDVAQSQMFQSQIQFLVDSIKEDVGHIQALGGIIKDLDFGLVDFLGDVDGQDVWLCWKRGERAVRFWHSLDSGFAQRKALPQPFPHTTRN